MRFLVVQLFQSSRPPLVLLGFQRIHWRLAAATLSSSAASVWGCLEWRKFLLRMHWTESFAVRISFHHFPRISNSVFWNGMWFESSSTLTALQNLCPAMISVCFHNSLVAGVISTWLSNTEWIQRLLKRWISRHPWLSRPDLKHSRMQVCH